MKRRRILSDCEEEEVEDRGRRNSLRKRERISYTIDQSDEDEDTEEEEEEEDQEDNEQLGPSTQLQQNNQGEQAKNLPVTCGVKKGSLDVEKLAKGVDCILCESQWFSPPAFETYAGKHSWKKWKATIFYNGEPLQSLFDKGILTAKSYKARRTATTKPQKILSSDVESGSSFEEIYSGEETEEDDVQDNNWLPEKREKEWQGAESGGDVNTTEEEEDKIEEWETEDESVPAVTGEDNNGGEGGKSRQISSLQHVERQQELSSRGLKRRGLNVSQSAQGQNNQKKKVGVCHWMTTHQMKGRIDKAARQQTTFLPQQPHKRTPAGCQVLRTKEMKVVKEKVDKQKSRLKQENLQEFYLHQVPRPNLKTPNQSAMTLPTSEPHLSLRQVQV